MTMITITMIMIMSVMTIPCWLIMNSNGNDDP
jgi:hypothetical protein